LEMSAEVAMWSISSVLFITVPVTKVYIVYTVFYAAFWCAQKSQGRIKQARIALCQG